MSCTYLFGGRGLLGGGGEGVMVVVNDGLGLDGREPPIYGVVRVDGGWGRGVVGVPVAIDMRKRKIRSVETIRITVRKYGEERKKRRRESQV